MTGIVPSLLPRGNYDAQYIQASDSLGHEVLEPAYRSDTHDWFLFYLRNEILCSQKCCVRGTRYELRFTG